jgi:hypothetical protein
MARKVAVYAIQNLLITTYTGIPRGGSSDESLPVHLLPGGAAQTSLFKTYIFCFSPQEIFGFTTLEEDIEDDLEIVAAAKVIIYIIFWQYQCRYGTQSLFKGTITRDSRPVFSSNDFPWAPYTRVKAFSNMASNSRILSTKLVAQRCQ